MARTLSWASVGLVYACTVAVVAAADSRTEPAKRFLNTLLQQPSAAIGKPEGCLASKPGAPATVGRELSAIFGNYIDAEWPFAIVASCERDGSPARQFCRLAFFHRDETNEASVGFIFRGNPEDGSLDTRTLECFQTP
jgi:hypothetical protein